MSRPQQQGSATARPPVVRLVDDVDGSEIDAGTGETVSFELDGVSYEIDLTDDNAAALRAVLAPFVARARRSGGRLRRARRGAAPASGAPPAATR